MVKCTCNDDTLTKQRTFKIGNTTYIVSSFFNQKAKGNVLDKISRLIEREAQSAILLETVAK